MFPTQPLKLADCTSHGVDSQAELFIVEGDSASLSVCKLRNERFQAVLPMQGKPMNTLKCREDRVRADPFFGALIDAIGSDISSGTGGLFDLPCRYRQIVLLFDPDADGIHSATLMLIFFYRWMKPLLTAGQVSIVRPPMMEIIADTLATPLLAYTEVEGERLCTDANGQRRPGYSKKRFRGLASFNADMLHRCCVNPTTRSISRLTVRDAESSIQIMATFEGK